MQEISKRGLAPGGYSFGQEFPDIPGAVNAKVGESDQLTVTFFTGPMRTGLIYSSTGSPPPVEFWRFNPIKRNWFMFSA